MNALSTIAADPGPAGLFLDFDGTLAEIVPDPERAAPVEGTAEVLSALARRFAVVAVVSGRRAVGLAERLGRIPGVRFYGLYGLEDLDGPVDPASRVALRSMRRLLPELERVAAAVPGAWVEPKGFHASIHYRAASDVEAAREAIVAGLGSVLDGTGMRALEGKRVVEVAPEQGPSKGDVVRRVAGEERLRGILYAGDDLPDLGRARGRGPPKPDRPDRPLLAGHLQGLRDGLRGPGHVDGIDADRRTAQLRVGPGGTGKDQGARGAVQERP